MTSDRQTQILCIAGSPRRRGNSEQLLDACIAGIESEGASANKLVVVEYSIEPCRGCNACSSSGKCVIPDRMHEIYPMLDQADAVVISSPIFFAGVPAVLKALYDRCQPYWARKHVLGEVPTGPKRPAALILVRGGGDPYGFESAVNTTKSVFAVVGLDYTHELKIVGPDSPSDMAQHVGALGQATELGEMLAQDVKQ